MVSYLFMVTLLSAFGRPAECSTESYVFIVSMTTNTQNSAPDTPLPPYRATFEPGLEEGTQYFEALSHSFGLTSGLNCWVAFGFQREIRRRRYGVTTALLKTLIACFGNQAIKIGILS